MKQKNEYRERLIDAILNQDIDVINTIHEDKIKLLKDKIIFVECKCNGTWRVTAIALGWVQNNSKTLNTRQFAEIIAKYDFQVMELTHGPLINDIPPNEEREAVKLSQPERIEYFTKELEQICKEIPGIDSEEWDK